MKLPSVCANPAVSDRAAGVLRRVRYGLLVAVIVYAIGGGIGQWIAKYWRIGVELQDETRCLPWTVWLVKLGVPEKIERGTYVAFIPQGEVGMGIDDMVRKSAAPRFLVKQVAAVPGDAIVVIDNEARMGGQDFGPLTLTTIGRLSVRPGGYDRVEIVAPGRLGVAGTLPRSYDSRYWGTAGQSEVVGAAFPLY